MRPNVTPLLTEEKVEELIQENKYLDSSITISRKATNKLRHVAN